MKQATATAVTAPRPKHLGKPSLARAVKLAVERDGRKLTAIADDFDTDAPNLCRWGQAHEPNNPHTLHLIAAAGTASHGVAVDVHRAVGDELGVQSIPRVDVVHDDHLARLASVTIECSDVPRVLAVALADGELSDDELDAIRLEGRQSIAAVLELDAWAARELLRRRGAR